jgi:hypothetical protein
MLPARSHQPTATHMAALGMRVGTWSHRKMWVPSAVRAAETDMFQHHSPKMNLIGRELAVWAVAGDGLRMGLGQSAPFPAGVKEVVTLLVNSKSVEKQSCIRRLKARETGYIPPVKPTPMALESDRRALPNRVCRDSVG